MTPYQVAEPFDPADYVYPRFSDGEYARRHDLARSFMADRDLDCLLITGGGVCWDRAWSNILYMTNYVGTMELTGYLVFPVKEDPVISILRLNASLPDRAARCLFGEVRGSVDYADIAADYMKRVADMSAGTIATPDLWADAQRESLYNLADDPAETTNLAASAEQEKLAPLRQLLDNYEAYCAANALAAQKAVAPEEFDEEAAERLRSLGYL